MGPPTPPKPSAPAGKPAVAPKPSAPPAKKPAAPKTPVVVKAVGPSQPSETERKWALAAHLGSAVGGVLAPLVTLSAKKDSPFVAAHSRESLNFQLTIHIVEALGLVLTVFGIGALIFFAAWGVGVIFSMFGAAKAWNGMDYKYPFSIRFLKS